MSLVINLKLNTRISLQNRALIWNVYTQFQSAYSYKNKIHGLFSFMKKSYFCIMRRLSWLDLTTFVMCWVGVFITLQTMLISYYRRFFLNVNVAAMHTGVSNHSNFNNTGSDLWTRPYQISES